jgi:membrane protein DedA with SNARE-associated domain
MPELLSSAFLHDLVHTYGLWVLFFVVMGESMGVPMPGETVLVSAALYAGATHGLNLLHVIAVASAGAIIGDNIGYFIGHTIGLKLLTKYGRYIRLDEGRLKVGQYLFLKHGGKIVFFGRFVAFLRAFAAVLAGANRMNWPHFLLMNAAGGICWATLFGCGAYFFGERIRAVAGPLSLAFLLIALIAVAAGFVFFRHHEKELELRARAALPDRP